MPGVSIRIEQAVYGSFPFWDKGYAVLARSPACRDEWIADFRVACQRYGEQPVGATHASGLIALKLASGPWAIIGPCPQGTDDRGRPGATAFHAVFVSGSDYRKVGAWPFILAKRLRNDWTAETITLTGGLVTIEDVPDSEAISSDNPFANRIAKALHRGQKVAIEASEPIDDLAEQVWRALPLRRRARLNLATWTFANGSQLDFLATPRLGSVVSDSTYLDGATLLPESASSEHDQSNINSKNHLGRLLRTGLGLISLAPLGLIARHHLHPTQIDTAPPASQTVAARESPPARGPAIPPPSAVVRRRMEDGIISLADRFGILDQLSSTTDLRSYVLLTRFRERLSYRDTLPPLEGDVPRLACFIHLDRFLPDRPLPTDFNEGPLDWQLRVVAWSFHLDCEAMPAEAIPSFISESLSIPTPIKLSDGLRSPALDPAVRFLRRLPIR